MIYGMLETEVDGVLLAGMSEWIDVKEFRVSDDQEFAKWLTYDRNGRYRIRQCCPIRSVTALRG